MRQHLQLSALVQVLADGWPDHYKDCLATLKEYFNFCDELTVENGVILKGSRILIPKSLRSTMVEKLQYGHTGVDKCIKSAHEIMFWPNIATDITNYITQCNTCLESQNSNTYDVTRNTTFTMASSSVKPVHMKQLRRHSRC